MTRLDSIDSRTDPKAWNAEINRIGRQREVRFACLEIFLGNSDGNLTQSALLDFVRADDRDYAIRLKCLQLAAEQPYADQQGLLRMAAKFVELLTAADNG